MAKKLQVQSLSENALAELANQMVTAIAFSIHSDDEQIDTTITIVEINTYLENAGATSDIYQDLLRIILSSDSLEASVRFTCLQMLLNGSVQCLVTEIFPFSYYEKILQVIAAQGSGLKVLNLKGVWVKEEHMHYMFEILEKCTNLTKLSIPHIANDDLLGVLGRCSKNLRVIDISGQTDITDLGVEYLSKGVAATRLKVIDIGMLGEENICHTDVALFLENCPELESLATYSFVGAALKHIYDTINANFKCKLKYLHDTKTNLETLDVISKTCPRIESIYLDSPNHGILYKLKNSKALQKLKIYKFYSNELLELMESIGSNIKHLTVIKGHGIFDIGRLAKQCPGLLDLDCYMMDMLSYVVENKFNNLLGIEMLSTPISLIALKRFICNTSSLKRLAIDTVALSDDDIASIFIEKDFRSLEDVWFTSAPNLTIASIETLMERCPELQSIGQLSGWALTPDDLALIRGLLKSGNSCLVLSPTTLFP